MTRRANESAYARYDFVPSYLRDIRKVDMRRQVFGCDLQWPVILSPTGMSRVFHPAGEIAVATEAAQAGLAYALSTMATTSIEDVAATGAGPKLYQLYMLCDDSLNIEMIDRCKAAGFDALCLTVDTVVAGNRERDLRHGLTIPPRLGRRNLLGFASKPAWCLNYLAGGGISLPNVPMPGGGNLGTLATYFARHMEQNITWSRIELLMRHWGKPFIIKGLQSVADARDAASAGVTGVIVSNHGGRQLDGGSAIMASAARNITKVSLELGGKAPAIILDDADIDLAVAAMKTSKTINSGQACNCTERIYVQRAVHAEFCEKLVAAFGSTSFGDPLGETPVEMGPLINRGAVERIEHLVADAHSKGAEVLAGGSLEGSVGCYVRPTVLAGAHSDMHILQREIFGPVVLVDVIDDLDEGITRANDSEYGLSSSIFTRSLGSAMHAIASLKFGETYVNRENFEAIQGFHAGVRRSGVGGADGKHGLYKYTLTQLAYIQS